MEPVIEESIRCIEQAAELMGTVSADLYTAEPAADATVGVHVRRMIEDCLSFLRRLKSKSDGVADPREHGLLEHDPRAAFQRLACIACALARLEGTDLDRELPGTDGDVASTVREELRRLLMRSLEQCAGIAAELGGREVQLPEDFGRLPSAQHIR